MTLLRVCRVTPRIFAPSVTDNPNGSRPALRTMRPGCCNLSSEIKFYGSNLLQEIGAPNFGAKRPRLAKKYVRAVVRDMATGVAKIEGLTARCSRDACSATAITAWR